MLNRYLSKAFGKFDKHIVLSSYESLKNNEISTVLIFNCISDMDNQVYLKSNPGL